MSTLRNPVGPQPPAVYWRRRLLLALGVIAVIVVIVLIVTRPGASTPTGSNTKSPKPSSSESGTPNPNPTFSSSNGANAAACDPASVLLVAVTDSGSYSADAQPQISMKITNVGATPCSYDVGTDAQEYIITSGNDRIWSSKDCQTAPAALVQVLQPGAPLTTTPFAWDRTRSATDTCNATRPAVIGGGASYHLGVKLGTSESAETVQFVLN